MFVYSNKGVSMPPMRMHQNPQKIRTRINDNDCAPGLRKTADLARYYRTWTLLLLLMMIPTAIGKAVDDDFAGIIERMKKAGVLAVECD